MLRCKLTGITISGRNKNFGKSPENNNYSILQNKIFDMLVINSGTKILNKMKKYKLQNIIIQ